MWIRTKALFSTDEILDKSEWGDFVFCTDSVEAFNGSDLGGTTLRMISGESWTIEIPFDAFFEMLQSEIVIYGHN